MRNESYSELVTLVLTLEEKRRLVELADRDGSTMRGVLRQLLRAEAERRGV